VDTACPVQNKIRSKILEIEIPVKGNFSMGLWQDSKEKHYHEIVCAETHLHFVFASLMVSFKMQTALVVTPMKERDDPANAFKPHRPVAQDLVLYRINALEFLCAVSLDGARSLYGRSVEPAILLHIVTLSAPYVIDGRIMQSRSADDPFSDDFLFVFEEWFRTSRWWWHTTSWIDAEPNSESAPEKEWGDGADLDAKSTINGGIFVGGIATVPVIDNDHMSSRVFRQDSDDNDEYIILVIERRGSVNFYMDLMVHVSKTMRQVLRFLTVYFELRQDESTRMVVWAMRDDGTADLEDPAASLSLHSKHHSVVLDKTMGEMWEMLNKVQDDMVQDDDDDDDVQTHYEYWPIVQNTIAFYDNVSV